MTENADAVPATEFIFSMKLDMIGQVKSHKLCLTNLLDFVFEEHLGDRGALQSGVGSEEKTFLANPFLAQ